jgi:hypothetical protein
MKHLLLIAALFVVTGVMAQSPVSFKTTKHSFGKIKQKKPVTYSFDFTNTGGKPLVIEIASAECGCTTPEYSKEPFLKGKEGKIKITFNAESIGIFSKKVTVKFANIPDPVILTIEGEVMPIEAKS